MVGIWAVMQEAFDHFLASVSFLLRIIFSAERQKLFLVQEQAFLASKEAATRDLAFALDQIMALIMVKQTTERAFRSM